MTIPIPSIDQIDDQHPSMPQDVMRAVCEPGRLAALRRLNLLDTPAEQAFDRLAQLAARILEAPVALVSLVDTHRQFFKSCYGLPEPWANWRETPLSHSFCKHVVATAEPLVVQDARTDPVLRENLAIRDINVIAYLGFPLSLRDGHVIGSFCVIDSKPRSWTQTQIDTVRDLSASVMTEIELQTANAKLQSLRIDRSEVLETLARGAPLYNVLEGLIHTIEAQAPDMLGSVLLFDPNNKQLQHGAAPSLPADYNQAIDGIMIGPALGSCGTAAFRRQRVIVEDIAVDPLWAQYKDLAAKYGLRACWSEPIFSAQGTLLGTFALYHRAPCQPHREELDLIEEAASLAAVAIEHHQMINALKQTRDELEVRVQNRTAELAAANYKLAEENTRRRQTEALLAERNEDLQAFAFTVSHDLKAPLRGITGYAQELKRRHQQGLNPRAQFCVTQIGTAAGQLSAQIDDVLHYSRLGRDLARPSRIELMPFIHELLEPFQMLLEQHGVELKLELHITHVNAWRSGLACALANVVSNAIKYSRDARPPRVTIGADSDAEHVSISVADNGIGFDMRYADKIFELFSRFSHDEDFEGTGAGLAIAKRAIEKQHGRLRVESAPGKGSLFTIELPKVVLPS